jgi:acetolactate synthase-1/2/3 large subunit
MKASDALAQLLSAHKINTYFELVGGMITHLLDSISKSGRPIIISMHHEQAAAFAAEGVARAARGKTLAVAMGTSGPGATNLITGIGSCWFDSIPCLFITGQVNTHELKAERSIRQQGFQELDIVRVAGSLTKYAVRIDKVDQLLPEAYKAIYLALNGRQGPVLLDIPNDIQRAEIDDADVNYWIKKPLNISSDHEVLDESLESLRFLCANSCRPLICIGGGARWANSLDQWIKSANILGIPFVATLMGQERIIGSENYFNMVGSYGNREANWAVQNADLLLVIGARLDVRQTGSDVNDFARNALIIQVDIDIGQLNNRVVADLSIHGSAQSFFEKFELNSHTFPSLDPGWVEELALCRKASEVDEYADWVISPTALIRILNDIYKDQALEIVCDVGNHQMWAAQNIRLSEHQAIHYSGGMGAMGFALPAAIGISLQSRKKVIVITGDGSLQINIQELDTIKRLELDITIIVLNNFVLGMVKNFQDMYFDGRDQSTKKGYSSPSFMDISIAYGINALQATSLAEFNAALVSAKTRSTPLLIEVIMEGATECRPRLAFGSKLDDQYPKKNIKSNYLDQ